MKITKQLFALSFLLKTSLTFGQTITEKTDEKPYIEVIGTAENEVIPDEIYICFSIREKYMNKTKVTIQEQEEKLKNLISSLGIDLKNLYISDVNADYVKVNWQKKDILTKKEYTLKVSDANTVGRVFQELEKLEITDAFISKVSHSKLDSLRKEVKIMAINAAKYKADYLLMAIGEQTGKPLLIKENETLPISNTMRGQRSSGTIYYEEQTKIFSGNSEIEFQKIKIQSSIYVKFSIK